MRSADADVREILRLIDESELDELRIEMPAFKLHVRRAGAALRRRGSAPPPRATRSTRRCSAPSTARARPASSRSSRSATRCRPDTVVCLIEVMKMMNSVEAGVAGTIVEVCAENAQLVEFGAPLFRVA